MGDNSRTEIDDIRQMLQALLDRATATSSRFLTVESAANYSSLSPVSIRRLLSAGKLTAHRPIKGRVLIDRHQLDAYVLSTTATPRKGRGIRATTA